MCLDPVLHTARPKIIERIWDVVIALDNRQYRHLTVDQNRGKLNICVAIFL